MWKWFRWVVLVISITLFSFFSFAIYKFFINPKMSKTMLQNAEIATRSGITIKDQQNDFVSLEGKVEEETGRLNNPKSYTFSFLDVKSISLGTDDKYLYYKVQYWNQIPSRSEKVGNDVILGNMMKLNLTDEQGKEKAILVTSYSWTLFDVSGFETYYFYEPTGIEVPENKRFAHQNRDSKIFGGPGTDYLISAFPMEKLGLKQGQTIYLNFLGEAKSKKYTHASIDVLGGHGKMAALITWVIGSNEYQINDDFYK